MVTSDPELHRAERTLEDSTRELARTRTRLLDAQNKVASKQREIDREAKKRADELKVLKEAVQRKEADITREGEQSKQELGDVEAVVADIKVKIGSLESAMVESDRKLETMRRHLEASLAEAKRSKGSGGRR